MAAPQSPCTIPYTSRLEGVSTRCFLWAVLRHHVKAGFAAGSIAAATTAGALVAFGIRLRTPARPFNVIAGHLVGSRAVDAWGWVSGVTIWGIVTHVATALLWGVLCALLVGSARLRPWFAALLVTGLSFLGSLLTAWSTGRGLAAELALGDLLVLHLLLAIALVVGMRIAPLALGRR